MPRLELGTTGVKDQCVYQFHHIAILVHLTRFELVRPKSTDFKSVMSTNSIIDAFQQYHAVFRENYRENALTSLPYLPL